MNSRPAPRRRAPPPSLVGAEASIVVDRTDTLQTPHYAVIKIVLVGAATPLAVLIDWTRSGQIVPLALPTYSHHLRSHGGRTVLCKDLPWILHYPLRAYHNLERLLPQIDWTSGREEDQVPQNTTDSWYQLLRLRLIHGANIAEIAAALHLRPSLIHTMLREAQKKFRKHLRGANPLSPFRYGQALWGRFRLQWDALSAGYAAAAGAPLDATFANDLAQIVGAMQWKGTPNMPLVQQLPEPRAAVDSDDGVDEHLLLEMFGRSADDDWYDDVATDIGAAPIPPAT